MIAKYFSRKCDACDLVKYNTEIIKDATEDMDPPMKLTILSAIKLRYKIEYYNVKHDKNLSEVKDWEDWAQGQIPAIKMDGRGEVEKKVGVKGMESLARDCIKWFKARKDRRPSIIPTKTNIDLRQEG